MQLSRITPVLSLLSTLYTAHASDGPAFSTGPDPNNVTWVREAISTVVLPETPHPQSASLSLWVGMATDAGDLIQALALTYSNDQPYFHTGTCSNLGNNWCAVSSTLKLYPDGTQTQLTGDGRAVAAPGAHVTMHYVYNDDTGNYDQTTLVNGKNVSFLSTNSGHATGFGTATECVTDPSCGTIPAHSWINTTITLDSADPNYAKNNWKSPGVSGQLTTRDGGKTWAVANIGIPQGTLPPPSS